MGATITRKMGLLDILLKISRLLLVHHLDLVHGDRIEARLLAMAGAVQALVVPDGILPMHRVIQAHLGRLLVHMDDHGAVQDLIGRWAERERESQGMEGGGAVDGMDS